MTSQNRRSTEDDAQPPATTPRDQRLERLIERLPRRVRSAIRWLRTAAVDQISSPGLDRAPTSALAGCSPSRQT
jgi:hypothetical protein